MPIELLTPNVLVVKINSICCAISVLKCANHVVASHSVRCIERPIKEETFVKITCYKVEL